jgi:hypothetical protein
MLPAVSPLTPAPTRGRCVLAAVAVLLAACTAGCGTHGRRAPAPPPSRAPAPRSSAPASRTVRLHITGRGTLPAAVQLPGLARTTDGRVVAVGGLDAADASTATLTRVLPAPARATGRLSPAAHDIGTAAIGRTVYAFGGGTATGPIATITALGGRHPPRAVGRLPVAMSDTTAVTLGHAAYVIGGFTTTAPLRSVLAFRPGRGVGVVASLPHPVRYAAAAAIGRRIYVAGGTTGTHAWRDIVAVDPRARRTRIVGRLPRPIAHAAGATLNGLFYILGGRGDALDAQRSAIWAFDPRTRRLRRAGRLPLALSDLAAVADGRRLVVVGGRDRAGRVHAERWLLGPG